MTRVLLVLALLASLSVGAPVRAQVGGGGGSGLAAGFCPWAPAARSAADPLPPGACALFRLVRRLLDAAVDSTGARP